MPDCGFASRRASARSVINGNYGKDYESISWDEAFDIIAKEIHRIVDEYGVESI